MAEPFKFDLSVLEKGLESLQNKVEIALDMYVDTSAQKIEEYGKTNARWKNRTGHARNRLRCSWEKNQNVYTLKFAHGVDYGIYLEMAHGRKYAIIEETIMTVGEQEIMPGFNRFIERLNDE